MGNIIRKLWYMVAVAVFCFAPCLLGQTTASMDLTGAGSNVMDGVYVGPYTATVNGVSTQVICIDYADESYIGETWTANVTSLSPQSANYDALTYLVSQMLKPTTSQTQVGEIQFAIWALMGNGTCASSLNATQDAACQGYLTQAEEQTTATGSMNITLYTPNPNDPILCSGGGCPSTPPQIFISVPEMTPAVILLGFNLLALVAGALFLRRYTRFRFSTD